MTIDGKELRITLADFQSGLELQRALGEAIAKSDMTIDGIKINKDDPLKTDIPETSLSSILKTVVTIGISKTFEDALFKCAERAVVGEEKVNREFFEKEKNREYYFPIMIEIAMANLAPFVKGLLSMFSGVQGKILNILK